MPDEPKPDPFDAWWKGWTASWTTPPGAREVEIADCAYNKGCEHTRAERNALLAKVVQEIRERYSGDLCDSHHSTFVAGLCGEILAAAKGESDA